ncbi:MAG: PHP domain-containing protein [Clostridiales bacterium]|nr:PHP domain-containing protein [Clostridiales bacterium]
MHSYYSDDGEYSPAQLVQKCKECSISTMSITDHNCVRAISEGCRAAEEAGIRFLPGIEIDCTFQGINLHVLGYGIDYTSHDFYLLEKNADEQHLRASLQMLLSTQELGFHITENDMAKLAENKYWKDRWTGEMFAEILLSRPEYMDHPLLLPYRSGGERGDNPYVNFYWDYYAQGKVCYAEVTYPSLEQTIETIHGNGGIAILAHPGINLRGRYELLCPILEKGLDGIEVFSSYHDAPDIEYFLGKSREFHLLTTCGSDFHGKTKPTTRVGQSNCTIDFREITASLNKYFPQIN